ncbi:MAG: 1-acyl-sn-glycerol-3-phosphate acyltransferase [Bacilli bacterium]|nr:1-acyl-sn-glycerol-3-phosphate acyltransferase [Bacilli bacterium]
MSKKEIKRFDMLKKPIMPKWFLYPVAWFGSLAFNGPFATRTKTIKHGFKSFKEPALILQNHASMVDFADVVTAMFPHLPCWVVSIEEFVGREWIFRNIGCIAKRKFTNDIALIKRIVDIIKNKKRSVVIYPETRFSICGVTEKLSPALGKLAKLCGCRVIVGNQKGNFLHSPQWNKHPYRKVRVISDFYEVVSKEEVKTLSAEEIQKRIEEHFVYDEYKYQSENRVKIDSPERATNIHRVLYKCPICGSEVDMESHGIDIKCAKCGASWTLNEYGEIESETSEVKFKLPSDWYRWEKEEAYKEVMEGTYHFEDDVRIEDLINAKVGFNKIGTVHMTHDENGYILDGTLDDGSAFHLEKPCLQTPSMHIEYDFKGRGDALDIATLKDTWFVFLGRPYPLTKFNFTTEALYEKAMKEKEK